MTAETVARPSLADASPGLRSVSIAFAGGLFVLALLFGAEIAASVRVWTTSTAYSHCFLVIPIACYLSWDRRHLLHGLRPEPLPGVALLALPLAAAWLLSERLGIMEGRQLVLVSLVQVLVATVYGRRTWRVLSGPLLYLYFLVPSGAFLVPQLQVITTGFVRHGLELLSIPAYIDGNLIEIPEGTFLIAEACAGLRFLVASVAFGCLYALLMFRSPWRRAAFILVSVIVPIVANGFRALGIVSLGHLAGSAQAVAADHVLYGWIFFSIVILLLVAAGLPFRQDLVPHRRPSSGDGLAVSTQFPFAAVSLVLLIAASGPLAARTIERAGHRAVMPAAIDLGPGCDPQGPPDPTDAGGAPVLAQRFLCGGREYQVRLARLSPRSTAARLLAVQRRLTRAGSAEETTVTTIHGRGEYPPVWQLTQSADPILAVASATWVGARPAVPDLATRFRMARDSITGGELTPIVLAVAPVLDGRGIDADARRAAVAALVRLLAADQAIGARMQALAALH